MSPPRPKEMLDLVYELRAEKGLSYTQIGKIIGRDKSNVQLICRQLGLIENDRMMLRPNDPGVLGHIPPIRVPEGDPLLARLREFHNV